MRKGRNSIAQMEIIPGSNGTKLAYLRRLPNRRRFISKERNMMKIKRNGELGYRRILQLMSF
jgi:hypothetical protein